MSRLLRALFPLALAALLVPVRPAVAAAARPAAAGELLVSAAASLTDAVTAIARAYEHDTGTHVSLNFGPSSGLARQIVNGAPVDVFLSADEAQMDAVGRAGLIEAGTRDRSAR